MSNQKTIALTQLYKGDKGTEVRVMQALLIARGYSCGMKGIDGSFGPATCTAVVNCQKSNGLKVDGICGLETWTFLLSGVK